MTGPLAGVRVLDLSTLLPGPLATLMLADAGADVVRIERPGVGDEMRTYTPRLGSTSANYAMLNRGKRAFGADLKDPAQVEHVRAMAAVADVVVEQFRPGVAARLGLGPDDVRALNPHVVYCSITGYGQTSPQATRAGHDLNYLAASGLLDVVRDGNGAPPLPPSVLADIAGGTYPAVVNILLALQQRQRTGLGSHLDISMAHNLQVLSYGYFATHQASRTWPVPGEELLTGGSPRYRIYPTSDGRHLAVAALEPKFWERFVELVGAPDTCLDDHGHEDQVAEVVAELVASRTADHWDAVFAAEDACTCVVKTYPEAVADGLVVPDSPHRAVAGGADVGALHSPVAASLRPSWSIGLVPDLEPLPDLVDDDPWPGRPR
ncbi:CaiB/BaiF CoA transferase family protein [Aeromicrobium wangtongii]|uniref:CaiB/BaiF CoA transferase family protein n=1 Tax=Aeromicrobium wangtongii TaxID=2969247 RepID=UPI0020173722|nr:CaiB/BaiF CoA-transferase family protein [Aeromicrobium wangtongii]MCL3819394.1 CoA transferase [Aeromicrobium wangtongii]